MAELQTLRLELLCSDLFEMSLSWLFIVLESSLYISWEDWARDSMEFGESSTVFSLHKCLGMNEDSAIGSAECMDVNLGGGGGIGPLAMEVELILPGEVHEALVEDKDTEGSVNDSGDKVDEQSCILVDFNIGFCGDVFESIGVKVGCTTTRGSAAMMAVIGGMAELDNCWATVVEIHCTELSVCEAGMEKSGGTELADCWTFVGGGGTGAGIELDANVTFGGTGVVALETGGGGGGTLGRVNDLHRLTEKINNNIK